MFELIQLTAITVILTWTMGKTSIILPRFNMRRNQACLSVQSKAVRQRAVKVSGQDEKKAERLSRPALLYSRSTALELPLSIALSSVRQSRFYHPLCV